MEVLNCNHGPTRLPLSADQRDRASQAWILAGPALKWSRNRDPRRADSVSAILACRIVTLISAYDSTKASLRTWANRQVKYAASESRRMERDDVSSTSALRRINQPINCMSIHERVADAPRGRACKTDDHVALIDTIASEDLDKQDREADELREHLLKTLPAIPKRMLSLYSSGHSMKEAGVIVGLTADRGHQIRSQFQDVFRHRLEKLQAT